MLSVPAWAVVSSPACGWTPVSSSTTVRLATSRSKPEWGACAGGRPRASAWVSSISISQSSPLAAAVEQGQAAVIVAQHPQEGRGPVDRAQQKGGNIVSDASSALRTSTRSRKNRFLGLRVAGAWPPSGGFVDPRRVREFSGPGEWRCHCPGRATPAAISPLAARISPAPSTPPGRTRARCFDCRAMVARYRRR